jgi:hypothetical protein
VVKALSSSTPSTPAKSDASSSAWSGWGTPTGRRSAAEPNRIYVDVSHQKGADLTWFTATPVQWARPSPRKSRQPSSHGLWVRSWLRRRRRRGLSTSDSAAMTARGMSSDANVQSHSR